MAGDCPISIELVSSVTARLRHAGATRTTGRLGVASRMTLLLGAASVPAALVFGARARKVQPAPGRWEQVRFDGCHRDAGA